MAASIESATRSSSSCGTGRLRQATCRPRISFGAVVRLAPLIALDHLERQLLDLLVAGEAALARERTRGAAG